MRTMRQGGLEEGGLGGAGARRGGKGGVGVACLDEVAQHGDHGEAAVLDLVQLQLVEVALLQEGKSRRDAALICRPLMCRPQPRVEGSGAGRA